MKLFSILFSLGVFIIGSWITVGLLDNYQRGELFPPQQKNVLPATTNKVSTSNFIDSDSYERDDDWSTERSYSDYGDMDCSDFSSQSEAQDFFESEGGPSEDYHNQRFFMV